MVWKNGNPAEKRKRKLLAEELTHLLQSCKSEHDCLFIALKRAMLQIKDPTLPNPLELLAMQLVASNDARDHEFIFQYFHELEAAKEAEDQFAALSSQTPEPEVVKAVAAQKAARGNKGKFEK